MTPDILDPPEAWDAAEEAIEIWQEDRARRERAEWKAKTGW